MAEKQSRRCRNFATVVYPESAPSDWRDVLTDQFVPAFVSPLHDKDIDPLSQPKKPHYHVVVMYDGVKSIDQVQDLFAKIGGVGCEVVQSMRGYARYLCHLDNPEKVRYCQDDVTCYCGADYASVIGLATDKYKALSEMSEFCEKYNVLSFYLLSRYAAAHRTDWYRILCDCGTVYMKEYLKSRKWSLDQGHVHIFDEETGDIIF